MVSLILPFLKSYICRLPETLEDVEKMKANQKPFWKCVNPCARVEAE